MKSIVRLQITARKSFADGASFGESGPYERLVGRVALRIAIRWHSVVGDLIVDALRPYRFVYAIPMGLALLSESLLTGPEIVAMIGLPTGSGLDLKLLGGPEPFGKVEIIQYQGVRGTNLYPKAKPKALGTLHINFMAADLRPLRASLAAAEIPVTDYGSVSTIFGEGDAISFYSPAGLRIEVHERN